ncbi:Uncharacterized protein HZ326_24174 [Fusarium oxysporum f. sp. albedinis]|nr:Uncharacterized protein HZ326_24174 [Fusarium oxysporum f. sp. albedinis]
MHIWAGLPGRGPEVVDNYSIYYIAIRYRGGIMPGKLEDNIVNRVRMLLGPEATWRSDKQAESMRLIISLKIDQIAINMLPTGAGKSILFILPAVMRETGTSIIPFAGISLQRGHDMGV